MRVFVALWPDAPARAAVEALALTVAGRAAGRAMPAMNLHLTLVFIGAIRAEQQPAIERRIAQCLPAASDLMLDRVETFESKRIAYAAPTELPASLATAQQALADALRAEGLPIDARPFRPHVTLARHCARDRLGAIAGPLAPPIAWPARRIALVLSESANAAPSAAPFTSAARASSRPRSAPATVPATAARGPTYRPLRVWRLECAREPSPTPRPDRGSGSSDGAEH